MIASMSQAPNEIVMFAFANVQSLDVVGPLQILAGVNDERATPAYRLTILAERKGEIVTTSGMKLVADGAWQDLPKSIDTMIVAGGEGTVEALRNKILLNAVRTAAKRARRVVSVCSGSF